MARSESELLASWWAALRTDALVAGVLLCMIILLAALLSSQFRFRMKTEQALRERETRYRLLADNIADIVILFDGRGTLLYVSPSVEPVLGLRGTGSDRKILLRSGASRRQGARYGGQRPERRAGSGQ